MKNLIYKRKGGGYEARFHKGRDIKGKLIYGSVYGDTKAEVKAKRQEAINELDTNFVFKKDGKQTVVGGIRAYLNAGRQRLKPSTIDKYQMYTDNYIEEHFDGVKISQMNKDRVMNFVKDFASGHSDNTVKSVISFMRSALSEYLPKSIFDVKFKTVPPKKVNFFSEEQQSKLLEVTKSMGGIYYLITILCVYLGLRIGELSGLKWSDFDFDKKTVHIQRTCQRVKNYDNSGNKTQIIFTTPKSKTSDRIIPLPDFLIAILNSINRETYGESEYVISKNGKFVEPRTIQNWFRKILKTAGMETTNFHTTRHTFAVRALEKGFDPKTLSELLGHSNPTITMNRYGHCTMKHKSECMNRLEQPAVFGKNFGITPCQATF